MLLREQRSSRLIIDKIIVLRLFVYQSNRLTSRVTLSSVTDHLIYSITPGRIIVLLKTLLQITENPNKKLKETRGKKENRKRKEYYSKDYTKRTQKLCDVLLRFLSTLNEY